MLLSAHKDAFVQTKYYSFATEDGERFVLSYGHFVTVKKCGKADKQMIRAEILAALVDNEQSERTYCLIQNTEGQKEIEIAIDKSSRQGFMQAGFIHLTTEDGTLLIGNRMFQANSVAYIDVAPSAFASIMKIYRMLGFESEDEQGRVAVSETFKILLNQLDYNQA